MSTTSTRSSDRRTVGLGVATALVVGNMVGSGVFLLPSSLAAYGGISLVGWLFTAAGSFLLAWVFARMARGFPRTGGPYPTVVVPSVTSSASRQRGPTGSLPGSATWPSPWRS